MMGREPRYVRVSWAAERLGIGERTLWDRFRKGLIAGVRIGRSVRIEWPLRSESVSPSVVECRARRRGPSVRRDA